MNKINKLKVAVMMAVLCSSSMMAQDKPRWELIPAIEVKHTFVNLVKFDEPHEQRLETIGPYTYIAAYTADMVTSYQAGSAATGRRSQRTEVGPLCTGSHGMGCIITSYGSILFASLVINHLLLDHGKPSKWKDMIAGGLMGFGAGSHGRSAWENSQR